MSNNMLIMVAIVNLFCNINCYGMSLESYQISDFNSVFNRNLTLEEMSYQLQSNKHLNQVNNHNINYNIQKDNTNNNFYKNSINSNEDFWKKPNADMSDIVYSDYDIEDSYTETKANNFIKKHNLENETMKNGVIFDAIMEFGKDGINEFFQYFINSSLIHISKFDRILPCHVITIDNIVQYIIAYNQNDPLLSTYKIMEDGTVLQTPLNIDNYCCPTSELSGYEVVRFVKNNNTIISINMKQNVLTNRIAYTFTNNNTNAAYNFITIVWLLNNTNDRSQKILHGFNNLFNNIANNKININDDKLFLYVFKQFILNIKPNVRGTIKNYIEMNNTNKCKLLDNMLEIINSINVNNVDKSKDTNINK